jgi:hypothetical protein
MERREAPKVVATPRGRMLPPARASGAARATERSAYTNRLLRARGASRRSTTALAPAVDRHRAKPHSSLPAVSADGPFWARFDSWRNETVSVTTVNENVTHLFVTFPGSAAQHDVVRCRPGIVTNSESAAIPDQRCTTACCIASGTSQALLRATPYPRACVRSPKEAATLSASFLKRSASSFVIWRMSVGCTAMFRSFHRSPIAL